MVYQASSIRKSQVPNEVLNLERHLEASKIVKEMKCEALIVHV